VLCNKLVWIFCKKNQISYVLWIPKSHYRVNKSLKHFPVLSQMNRVPTFPPFSFKAHFDIILPSLPRFFNPSYLQFLSKIFVGFLFFALRVNCLVYLIQFWLNNPTNVWGGIPNWNAWLWSILHHVISSLLGPIFFSSPYSRKSSAYTTQTSFYIHIKQRAKLLLQ
jgi:hypothetical protein